MPRIIIAIATEKTQQLTSGATYVGVPTRLVRDSGVWTRRAKPKSVTLIVAWSVSLISNKF